MDWKDNLAERSGILLVTLPRTLVVGLASTEPLSDRTHRQCILPYINVLVAKFLAHVLVHIGQSLPVKPLRLHLDFNFVHLFTLCPFI